MKKTKKCCGIIYEAADEKFQGLSGIIYFPTASELQYKAGMDYGVFRKRKG